MSKYFLGVDVGSYSVRAGLFLFTNDNDLKFINKNEKKINVYSEEENFFEQSSEEIWETVCHCVKDLIADGNINSELIKGIGFDATCSLVVLDKAGNPLSVSRMGTNNKNIIMWMDHRAIKQTNFINKTGHSALNTVGGKISIEMQPPKLMWLKENIPDFVNRVGHVFDLTDYLTFRATGSYVRSLCSVICKWCFDAENMCWNKSFLDDCGLEKFCDNDYAVIGNTFYSPGRSIEPGLSAISAFELGLKPGINVPASLIDAYAGVLGSISNVNELVVIAGTSACYMSLSDSKIFVNGVWGPYKNVLFQDYYVLEAGQTAVGNLLDRLLTLSRTSLDHSNVLSFLLNYFPNNKFHGSDLLTMPSELWQNITKLTETIHINPDFLGNRSPRSDSVIRGSIIGLGIDDSPAYVSKVYLAAVQGIVYGFKEILAQLFKHNIKIESLVLTGGFAKNELYVRTLADVTGIPVFIYPDVDFVLYGAARLNVLEKCNILNNPITTLRNCVFPDKFLSGFHEKKFSIYNELVQFQTRINNC